MEEYFIIKSFKKGDQVYFRRPRNDEDLFNSDDIWRYDVYSAEKFADESSAKKFLINGRDKYYWGGIFIIEKIYISR